MQKVKLPKLNILTLRKAFLSIFVITVSLGVGYLLGYRTANLSSSGPLVTIERTLPENKKTLEFSLFWKVWDTLSVNYFDKTKLKEADMVYGAISGMVASLGDPYTVFLPPVENKVVQEDLSGNFEGIGIQIGYRGGQLAVISPLPDTPAHRAGVKAGDFIVGIKDEKKGIDRGTTGISLPEAVEAIRGVAGSTVNLTLVREGVEEPIVVDIKREKIDVPSVTLEYSEDGQLAHVRVSKFGAETKNEWDQAVAKILGNPAVKGLVLDLRNDPGGYLQGAVDLASEFIATSQTVVIEEQASGEKQDYKVTRVGKLVGFPVVVLVNKGSASASEILAGALRDQNKSLLIGDTSFGKGTIQEPIQLEGGAGLHITIARWLTPSGFWVNEKGLEPDLKVADDPETVEDEQLLEAFEALKSLI